MSGETGMTARDIISNPLRGNPAVGKITRLTVIYASCHVNGFHLVPAAGVMSPRCKLWLSLLFILCLFLLLQSGCFPKWGDILPLHRFFTP